MAQLAYTVTQMHDKGTEEKPKDPVVPWGRSMSYSLIKSGQLKAKKVGDTTIVLHKHIEELLDDLPEAK